MPRQAMSSSAAFIAYVSVGSYRRFGSVLRGPALLLVRVTPPPPLLVAQSMASLGRPLASPLLWSISTFSHEIYHRGFVSRVGSI